MLEFTVQLIASTLFFQEYLEQWHLLENLQSDLGSEAHSEDRRESVASLHSSITSNTNTRDAQPASYHQEKVC